VATTRAAPIPRVARSSAAVLRHRRGAGRAHHHRFRAVLGKLRRRSRYHPDRDEVLTATGDITAAATAGENRGDVDVVDLLQWAVRSGVDAEDVALRIATECSRDRQHRRADYKVAGAPGITTRTLYCRRNRTLTALRGVAPQYLAAVA
jgi:hypothetical protein